MMALVAVALGINVLSLNYVASVGLRINKNKGLAARIGDCCQSRAVRRLHAGIDSEGIPQ
jgi:hypothetical protein